MANLNHAPDLNAQFKRLHDANSLVRELILTSSGDIFLPHTFKLVGDARLCVANALTELWFATANKDRLHGTDNSLTLNTPYSGLMCASPELIAAVDALNAVKDDFKKCVVALRDDHIKAKSKFQFVAHIKNDPLYQEAMRRAGINGLDLMACYRQIKVLDADVKSVRWVWQTNPKGVEKKRVKDLLEGLANNAYAGREGIPEMLQRILSGMKPTDYVAEVKTKKPKLRANLTYLAEGADPSLAIRKPIACSGILLSRDDRLPPNISWKDRPDDKTKERWTTSSIIEPEPFIAKTKLHFYRDGHMPTDKEDA